MPASHPAFSHCLRRCLQKTTNASSNNAACISTCSRENTNVSMYAIASSSYTATTRPINFLVSDAKFLLKRRTYRSNVAELLAEFGTYVGRYTFGQNGAKRVGSAAILRK